MSAKLNVVLPTGGLCAGINNGGAEIIDCVQLIAGFAKGQSTLPGISYRQLSVDACHLLDEVILSTVIFVVTTCAHCQHADFSATLKGMRNTG